MPLPDAVLLDAEPQRLFGQLTLGIIFGLVDGGNAFVLFVRRQIFSPARALGNDRHQLSAHPARLRFRADMRQRTDRAAKQTSSAVLVDRAVGNVLTVRANFKPNFVAVDYRLDESIFLGRQSEGMNERHAAPASRIRALDGARPQPSDHRRVRAVVELDSRI